MNDPKLPGIGLILAGLGGALLNMGVILFMIYAAVTGVGDDQVVAGISIPIAMIGVVADLLIAKGGFGLMKGENLPAARLAAILAMIPCCNLHCCFFALPIGLWAFMTVKSLDEG